MYHVVTRFRVRAALFVTLLMLFVAAAALPGLAQNNGAASGPTLLDNLEATAGEASYNVDEVDTANPLATFAPLVGRVIGGFLAVLGVVFLISMVYGGYTWLVARGNEEQVKKSQDIIRNAVIGVIIVVGAYAIVWFVLAQIAEFNQNLQGIS